MFYYLRIADDKFHSFMSAIKMRDYCQSRTNFLMVLVGDTIANEEGDVLRDFRCKLKAANRVHFGDELDEVFLDIELGVIVLNNIPLTNASFCISFQIC
jgi:hypothetical protein